MAPPSELLINLLKRIAREDPRQFNVEDTSEAAAHIIAAHIRHAKTAPETREEAFEIIAENMERLLPYAKSREEHPFPSETATPSTEEPQHKAKAPQKSPTQEL